jgi:RNA polymerase sigma-70 factor (ECF subfamily)
MNETKSDIELIKAINNGDAVAFTALLERYYDLIYRVAFRTLVNQQDAEDVAQEICIALPKKLSTFRGKSKLTTWIYQVTLNQCRDLMRKSNRSKLMMADFSEISELQTFQNEEHRKTVEWAYNAIDYLTEPWRETTLLVVAEGLTHAEAAEVLGIKESTVSWRMMEVREKLKAREEVTK